MCGLWCAHTFLRWILIEFNETSVFSSFLKVTATLIPSSLHFACFENRLCLVYIYDLVLTDTGLVKFLVDDFTDFTIPYKFTF